MACLLQPECNFLHSFFRCKLPVEGVDVEVKIMSMQGTHIFRRDQTMQVIKCTPWSARLHPYHTIIKTMKTFLEVEGKMGPAPAPTPVSASQFRPYYHIQTPTSEKIMLWRRGREQHPRDSGPWPPSLLLCVCPYQRSYLSPRVIHWTADQLQFMRAPHGLVQAKCQGTCLKIGTGYSYQTIQAMKIKL